jgi:hypothetical protein
MFAQRFGKLETRAVMWFVRIERMTAKGEVALAAARDRKKTKEGREDRKKM